MTKCVQLLCVALIAASLTTASASGLLIADGGFGGQLEITEHDVEVVINNGVAVTHVNQVFLNTEDRIVEALYVFPVPKNASVANFSMWIAGKEMVGEVIEKERAREIYNSYKRQMRDPGLLEQNDYKKFELRIFPIPARTEQRIQISYYQELDVDADWATYVYPLATAPVPGMRARTDGRFSLDLQVKSEVPVTTMESPSHADDFVMVTHNPTYHQASLEASDWDLNRDVVVAFQMKRARTGVDFIASNPDGEDGYLQMTMTAGDELAEVGGGMDFVFVLDISGSMADDGKLSVSKDAILAFARELGKEDRFEVMTFNVVPKPLFQELRAGGEAISETDAFLTKGRAGGGTRLRPAIESAYGYKNSDRPLNVVILSDGMTQQDERTEMNALIRERPSGTRVFCIGVGNEVNRELLESMAVDAGGLASFISRGDNFQRQARAFRRKLTRPAAANLRFAFEGGGIYDVEPRKMPNLYHGAPVKLYARYKKAGPVKVTVSADVAGKPIQREVMIELPEVGTENPEIERMWAWKRARRLQSELEDGGDNRLADEIVRLGEAYSIVTRHTSFLVLENDGEYKRWKIERRNALRIERDRRTQKKLTAQLENLRRQTPANLGPLTGERTADNNSTTPANISPPNTINSPATVPPSRNGDIDFGHSGSVDPITAILAAFLALGIWYGTRRGL